MDLKIHKMRLHWRICLGGLGWGLLSLWIPLTFPLDLFLRSPFALPNLPRLFLPEALAGALLVALLDRYISREQEKRVRWMAGALLCVLSLGIPLAETSWIVLHGGLFVSYVACGALLYPVVKEIKSPRQALTVFFWILLVDAAGMILGSAVLTVWQSFVWLRMVSAAILAVGGTWILIKRLDFPLNRKEDSVVDVALEKPLWLAAVSFLCLLAIFFQIAQTLRDAESLAPLSLMIAPLLLAGLVYIGRLLILSHRLWHLVYVAFACFALGAVCVRIPLSGAYAAHLSFFFYVTAAGAMAGLCVYFIAMGVSVYNRPLILGLFFIVCIWLVQMLLQAGILPVLRENALSPAVAPLLAIVVFVAGPLLFIPFARPEQAVHEPMTETLSEPAEGLTDAAAPPPYVTQFTGAEIKVYELILRGYTNQQIADALFISINTVKFHVKNILAKAGVNRRYKLYNAGLKPSDQ